MKKHSVFLLSLHEGELKLKPYPPKLKAIRNFWNGDKTKLKSKENENKK